MTTTAVLRRAVRVTVGALVLTSTALAAPAAASRGGIFVHDSADCSGNGNAAKVTLPFSVSGRDYPAFTDLEIYATDKRADETFGPFVVTTDASGYFCARVTVARATQWKLDLVEPGPGSTDSKVFWVEPSAPTTTRPATTTAPTTVPPSTAPTTTTPAPTTTVGVTTTIGGSTTTNVGGSTTTSTVAPTVAPTTTPTTTVAPTTPTSVVASSTTVDTEVDPPIDIEQIPRPTPSTTVADGSGGGAVPTLPATGSADPTGPVAPALALIAIGLVAVLAVRRGASAR